MYKFRYLIVVLATIILSACADDESGGGGGGGGGGGSGVDVSFSWTPPAEREDNTPLSNVEIVSYRIYYGGESGIYPYVISTPIDGSRTSISVSNLPSGRYYVVITAVTSDGKESDFSNEAVVNI